MDMTEVYEGRQLSSNGTLRHLQINRQKRLKNGGKRFRFKCIPQSNYWGNWGVRSGIGGGSWMGWKPWALEKEKEKRGAMGKQDGGRECEWQMSLISFHCLNLLFEKTPHVWPEKREKQNENRHQQSTRCTISKKCKLMTGSKNLQRKQHPSLSIAINKSSTAYGNVNFNMKR